MAVEAKEQPQESPQEEAVEEKEAAAEEEEAEEAIDLKPEIENACKPKCVKQLLAYQACERRIEEDEDGHKHCTGQYFITGVASTNARHQSFSGTSSRRRI